MICASEDSGMLHEKKMYLKNVMCEVGSYFSGRHSSSTGHMYRLWVVENLGQVFPSPIF